MKIVTIIGARPQFIKAAAVSRVIRPEINEILVHTGQHYDKNMSDIFFTELDIPKPQYHLGVGSGSHAKQTGEMLVKIEEVLLKEKPDFVLVYGDTNSTLAGALAAVKLHLPIVHVEAGLRSYNKLMPEEVNRILTDRISDILFCPTEKAVEILEGEGIRQNVYWVGDVMCDAVKFYSLQKKDTDRQSFFERLIPLFGRRRYPHKWYMATVHRAENTDDINKIKSILDAFNELNSQVIFPVHPRTKGMVGQLQAQYDYDNIYFCEPMGYVDMLYFTKHAEKAVTDSGGLQKEAYILKTPCVTIREQTEWVETLKGNLNILAHPDRDDILKKINETVIDTTQYADHYGDGHAADKIKKVLLKES